MEIYIIAALLFTLTFICAFWAMDSDDKRTSIALWKQWHDAAVEAKEAAQFDRDVMRMRLNRIARMATGEGDEEAT